MFDIKSLQKTVQKNCDLVDAKYAQSYGLCVYLLKMREYYRWRKKIPLTAELQNDEIHEWISGIEEYWEKIDGNPFHEIVLDDKNFDPFDTELINQTLTQDNIVYSGGLGYGCIPLFFLGKLESLEKRFGFSIIVSSEEFSRGLFGPLAFIQDNTIFVRKEALGFFVWARYDEWSFSKSDNPMKRALAFYDFEHDPDKALEIMTDYEVETLVQHEIGEGLLNREYGSEWNEMVVDFAHSRQEIVIRAVRDLAVDCMTTLPFIISEERESSLYFYFANFSDMRKELFPELYSAYKNWTVDADTSQLSKLVEQGKIFWFDIGKKILNMFQESGTSSGDRIEKMIDEQRKNLMI